ncbi:MAG: Crp/Fnr family transcriptional regulator [Nitrospirae bacterium]|nr:Crp/Fnr family transcriptional regulator [Nitrospirota bacterium]
MSNSGREDALIEKLLRNIPIFRSISETYIQQIARDVRTVHYKKGGTVFYQSDESMDLYIVLDGKLRASLFDEEGDELVLATFNKGDFFGEMSLLDGVARSATLTAEEDSALGILKRESFLQAIKQNPMIAIDLLAIVVKRLRKTDSMVESLVFFDVDERLVRLLLQIAKMQGERDSRGFYKVRKLTQKDLAARIGASREAISKALKILAIRKMVVEEDGFFLIKPDEEA